MLSNSKLHPKNRSPEESVACLGAGREKIFINNCNNNNLRVAREATTETKLNNSFVRSISVIFLIVLKLCNYLVLTHTADLYVHALNKIQRQKATDQENRTVTTQSKLGYFANSQSRYLN